MKAEEHPCSGEGCLECRDFDNRQVGRKEVVEFVSSLIIGIDGCKFEERLDGDKGCLVLDMNENQWQAKLKDWNISA